MIAFYVAVMSFIAAVANCDVNETSLSSAEPRGGYGGGHGGGYGGYGGGHGGGGYGGGGYGGGGHHHGSISMDPVSILGLLSLGAVILSSILNVLLTSASGRSLKDDGSDINLLLSDIPEAVADWHQRASVMMMSHTLKERSVGDDEPSDFLSTYNQLLRTEPNCISNLLCNYWTSKNGHSIIRDENLLDMYTVATAGYLTGGSSESAAIYDQIMTSSSDSTAQRVCQKASDQCTHKKFV